ncbi:MAG: hypothetical protein ABJA10_06840, partial [Aestuariivirga sp.]
MRFIIGFLSGILGMLAGWAGLAFLVVSLAGPDRDGGIAMGAFFQIGPIGGVIGFFVGAWLFIKLGVVRRAASPSDASQPDAGQPDAKQPDVTSPPPVRTHISRPFAVAVLLTVGVLAWIGWYELIRSPYLSHGFMTLELQFKLPAGMALPPEATDVHITVEEGQQHIDVNLGPRWRGTDGDHRAILAKATLSRKTSRRVVVERTSVAAT